MPENHRRWRQDSRVEDDDIPSEEIPSTDETVTIDKRNPMETGGAATKEECVSPEILGETQQTSADLRLEDWEGFKPAEQEISTKLDEGDQTTWPTLGSQIRTDLK